MTDNTWTVNKPRAVTASAEKGIYEIYATKIGAPAVFSSGTDREGRVYTWSKKGIEGLKGTGVGGRTAINHKPIYLDDGTDANTFKIVEGATIEDGRAKIKVKVPPFIDEYLSAARVEASEGQLFHEVSIECDVTDYNDEEMTLDGGYITGISFTFGDHVSKCTAEDGCGVIASSANIYLPSNNYEDSNMTETDEYKALYEELKAEFDSFKVKSVEASEVEKLQEENQKLKEESAQVVASFEDYKAKAEPIVESYRESKLAELKAMIGEESAQAYASEELPEIDKALSVAASVKAKIETEDVPKDSGAPVVASEPPTGDELKNSAEELERWYNAFNKTLGKE